MKGCDKVMPKSRHLAAVSWLLNGISHSSGCLDRKEHNNLAQCPAKLSL